MLVKKSFLLVKDHELIEEVTNTFILKVFGKLVFYEDLRQWKWWECRILDLYKPVEKLFLAL